MRKQARGDCRVLLHRNKDIVNTDPEGATLEIMQQFVGIAIGYNANVSGTDGFWRQHQGKLKGTVDQLLSTTVLSAFSAADHY